MVPHESFHGLRFWMEYLRARRRVQAKSLPNAIDGALRHHVDRVYKMWWVGMRYRPDFATASDVERVLRAVSWLQVNIRQLWS